MVGEEFRGVGRAIWDGDLEETTPPRIRAYIFGLDAGPDNVGFTKLVASTVRSCMYTMIWVVWCRFHQYHLIVRSMLVVLDSFTWSNQPYGASYFAGLCTICNTWREAGNPHGVAEKAT